MDNVKKFIDYIFDKRYYLQNPSNNDILSVKIMGGELTLDPELVDKIISYINYKATINNIRFQVLFSTNGTLLRHKSVYTVLKKWKNVIGVSTISFDGSPINNDISRIFKDGTGSGTHILNNMKVLRQELEINSANFDFSCVFDKGLIKYFYDSLLFLKKLGYFTTAFSDNEGTFSWEEITELESQIRRLKKIGFKIENSTDRNKKNDESDERYLAKLPGATICNSFELSMDQQGNILPCVSFNNTVFNKCPKICHINDLNSNDIFKNDYFEKILNRAKEMLKDVKCPILFCPARLLDIQEQNQNTKCFDAKKVMRVRKLIGELYL
jgi:sulfatase maturation enzyme AslB (radical SAM superfamily)